jgi:hypothetical protein
MVMMMLRGVKDDALKSPQCRIATSRYRDIATASSHRNRRDISRHASQ